MTPPKGVFLPHFFSQCFLFKKNSSDLPGTAKNNGGQKESFPSLLYPAAIPSPGRMFSKAIFLPAPYSRMRRLLRPFSAWCKKPFSTARLHGA